MEPYTSYSDKRTKLIAAAALTALLLLPGAGCAKDTTSPVIRSYGIYQNDEKVGWVVEGETVDFIVNASDDRGVKEGYVQLDNGLIVPLSSISSGKEGENPVWKGSTNEIPVGFYVYELVVFDAAKNEAKEKGRITVHPFDGDGDGIGYRDELKYGTNPNKADTDEDGVNDYDEIYLFHTNPLVKDWKNAIKFNTVLKKELNTPEKVNNWTINNIKYRSETINEYVPAIMVVERGYDDCDGFAILQSYLLEVNGLDAYMIGLSVEGPIGHNVAGVNLPDGKILVLDNYGMKVHLIL